ncbi:hypothetical protein GPICK_08180 [Geobacter pickeringii]|uniref:Uncharacterized protein n=1 Tax=Geobacter pickeringii TaxID=345632 RepID=A0A0B5BDY8_9BACT|nr:hypothetical protein GPICK_08180 [Geobacter pickeringii]
MERPDTLAEMENEVFVMVNETLAEMKRDHCDLFKSDQGLARRLFRALLVHRLNGDCESEKPRHLRLVKTPHCITWG